MSNRHPELIRDQIAPGISYACAYMRLEKGWDLARAISEPTHKRDPDRAKVLRAARDEARRDQLIRRREKTFSPRWKKPVRTRARSSSLEDTSPMHIRRLRARYCDLFVKTGVLDASMSAQLRKYAHDCRSAKEHTGGIPDEPKTRRYGRASARAGDDGLRDALQTDRATAERVADFLRSS